MSGGRLHHSSARRVVCRLCDTSLAADLLPLHSHYCTTAQQALLTQPPQKPPQPPERQQPHHTRFIDQYCTSLALNLSLQCKALAEEQSLLRQAEAAGREELKVQLLDEEEADDTMLDVTRRMEQVMRDTVSTYSWIALQHIFHALKTICRRCFAIESPCAADRQQLKDELLLLARLCAAAIKHKMRTVATDSRPTSPASSDTPPLPRRHSASAVHSDPSTPQRGSSLRGVSSPDGASSAHRPSAPISHPSSVPSRSSRFNPSSRAQLSSFTNTTPSASRPASPALVLSSAPSLSHSISSPTDSTTAVSAQPVSDSPLAQRPVADYQQLSYELGRKALLHTYMRRSSTRASSSKRQTNRIGGSGAPSPPRMSDSPPPPSPPPFSERKESESERVKDEDAADGLHASMKDFHFIRCLSVGGSSRVWLCEKRSTGDKYAVKVMRKHELLHRNNAHRAMLERHILSLSSHPYIVPLYYAIPSRHHLYLVLEYMRGGDLADLLHTSPSALTRRFVVSVLSEVVLSLEYLHQLGFVHRDVKPENIMLDGTGHVKLGDFGLSKHCMHVQESASATSPVADATSPPSSHHKDDSSASDSDSTHNATATAHTIRPLLPSASRHSAVGTHHYLAPETILGLPITPAVDWWALGVLAFHLLIGRPPFANADGAGSVEGVMDDVVRGKVRWPAVGVGGWEERMGRDGVDLVKRLLVVEMKQRLGSSGAEEIKRHPIFAGVEWDVLMQQKGDSMDSSITGSTPTAHAAAGALADTSSPYADSSAVFQPSVSMNASNLAESTSANATPSAYFTGSSHVPSSRARHSVSTSPSISADTTPSTQPLPTTTDSPILVDGHADVTSHLAPPADTPPQPSRSHLLTSLPAFTASSEFERYVLSDTPSPTSPAPAKLASPSLPSYLTSLASVPTDLSLSALASFPSLSEASSSLLMSLSLRSSALLPQVAVTSSPVVQSANQSSLDRLLSLTRPSAHATRTTDDSSIVSRPLTAHTALEEQSLSDVAETQDGQEEQQAEQQLPRLRSKSRDRSHAVQARRKISASAKIASRTLRSPYATLPSRPLRLSPPASFRSAHRSPPAAALVRRSRKSSFDISSGLVALSVLDVMEWSSDADNGDADSDLDRVSEMRKEAVQARRRKDLSRTSPTVQQREQRHYARKSPAVAARRVGTGQPADGVAAFTVEPLSSDSSAAMTASAAGMDARVGSVRAVLEDVTLSEYVPSGVHSSPPTPSVPEWLLPASDESSEWSEFCSDFSERSDRLAGSASDGGGISSGGRVGGGGVGGESGVSSAEFASDWSGVGSEDDLFDGFAFKNLVTLQAKNEQMIRS